MIQPKRGKKATSKGSLAVRRDKASKARHSDRTPACLAKACQRPGLAAGFPVCDSHWKRIGPDVKPLIDGIRLPEAQVKAKIRALLAEALRNI